MVLEVIYWLTAALALLGVWLNIHRRRVCFAIWAVTNATWTAVDLAHGIYAQAALQATYFAMSIYGLAMWSRRRPDEVSGA